MWRRALQLRALPPARRALSTTAQSQARVLCVGVPQTLAQAAASRELVQRGLAVESVASSDDLPALGGYDALLVSPSTELPRDLLREGARGKLRFVAVAGDQIESDLVDMMDATNHGLMLLQLEQKQTGARTSVEAELAVSLMLQLARHIPESIATVKAAAQDGKVRRELFTGTELAGKCIGVVGLGQTGSRVVELALALGMEVVGYDPNLTQEAAALLGVARVELPDLFEASDFITFHAPLTARTRGMFNAAALERCKFGVHLISVAENPGTPGLLDEQAVLSGLDSGKIGGLALDVLVKDGETMASWSPEWQKVLEHEHVLAQKHAVGSTASQEAHVAQTYRAIAENVCDAIAHRDYRGVANGVFMPLTLLPEMQPYLALGEALGRLVHQLIVSVEPKDRIAKVSLATSGGVTVDITTPKARSALQSALLKGMLESRAQYARARHTAGSSPAPPTISLLNASLLAMTSGMDVRQGDLRDDHDVKARHLSNSVTVHVETKSKQKLLVQGSVFGEDPRVVRVNEYSDFPAFRPSGNLLLFNNQDRPGAIAAILKELADAQVNIANFGLARHENVPLALGILSLDSPPPPEAIAALQKLPSVEKLLFAQL